MGHHSYHSALRIKCIDMLFMAFHHVFICSYPSLVSDDCPQVPVSLPYCKGESQVCAHVLFELGDVECCQLSLS